MTQSLVKNLIHIIFSTKNRESFLDDTQIQGELHAFLKGACDKLDCSGLKVGGTGDHVHILCHLSKNVAGAHLIKEIKRVSSIWIKSKGPAYYDFHWQSGYAYFSVSPKDVDAVVGYINNQKKHHKTVSFRQELLGFFHKYDVEYDDRYLWD